MGLGWVYGSARALEALSSAGAVYTSLNEIVPNFSDSRLSI